MPYRLKFDQPVETEVKRVALEQLKLAEKELTDSELDRNNCVHQVRKRLKKLRGLLRLVRPVFEYGYRFENNWFRDTGRKLSPCAMRR